MGNGATFAFDAGRGLQGGSCIADPGTGNAIDLKGRNFGVCRGFGAGTYKLPNVLTKQVGTVVFIVGDAAQTWNNATGTLRATIASGEVGVAVAVSTSDWKVQVVSGAGDDLSGAINALIAENATTLGATYNSASTLVGFQQQVLLPGAQFNTSSTTSTVVPTGAVFAGARQVYWQNTADAALGLTTPTAADIYAAYINGGASGVGHTYLLTIINRGDNTITITGGSGVTVTGENTVATVSTRTYLVTLTSASAVNMRSVDKGTIET